jgi:glucose-1-phosphate cytidylyltransferase
MRAMVEGQHHLARRVADSPKPMALLGGQPLLWHLMMWYSHWGHKEFILCLGHGGDVIRDWCRENSSRQLAPRLSHPPEKCERLAFVGGDEGGWDVTLVETGLETIVGQRLRKVRAFVDDEDAFLANYADGLSDVCLPELIDVAATTRATATFLSVPLQTSLHMVSAQQSDGLVTGISPLADHGIRVNGGFFVLRREIFDVLQAGEELVAEPFQRLIAQERLAAHRHDGFWVALDTAKDRFLADQLWQSGLRPWAVWQQAVP